MCLSALRMKRPLAGTHSTRIPRQAIPGTESSTVHAPSTVVFSLGSMLSRSGGVMGRGGGAQAAEPGRVSVGIPVVLFDTWLIVLATKPVRAQALDK